jgi:hypothetical protein
LFLCLIFKVANIIEGHMNKQQQKVLTEAVMLNEVVKIKLLEKKLARYNSEVLNEQFFKKLGQGLSAMGKSVARSAIPGYKGYGGAETADIASEVPEMKALDNGLKAVEAKAKSLKGMNIGNIDALDGALDQYVTSLVDLYSDFKDIADDREKQNALPDVLPKLQSAFKTARGMLQQLQLAVADASKKLTQAVQGSELARTTVTVPSPRTGIPAASGGARPESYGGAAGARSDRGVGGSLGARGRA